MFSKLRGGKNLSYWVKNKKIMILEESFFSFMFGGGHNKIKCLLSAYYMINSTHNTWNASDTKTRSPALVEYTVYGVFPLHLCTACYLGRVAAHLCPVGEQTGWLSGC